MRSGVDLAVEGLPKLLLPRAIIEAVAAGSDQGWRSVEELPCSAAEPALNVAVAAASDQLDAEAAAGGAQRPADAAGELGATGSAAGGRPGPSLSEHRPPSR